MSTAFEVFSIKGIVNTRRDLVILVQSKKATKTVVMGTDNEELWLQ